jgi:hypothetical protein
MLRIRKCVEVVRQQLCFTECWAPRAVGNAQVANVHPFLHLADGIHVVESGSIKPDWLPSRLDGVHTSFLEFRGPLKHPDAEYLIVAVLAPRIHFHITLHNKYSAITPRYLAGLFVRRVLCTWK